MQLHCEVPVLMDHLHTNSLLPNKSAEGHYMMGLQGIGKTMHGNNVNGKGVDMSECVIQFGMTTPPR